MHDRDHLFQPIERNRFGECRRRRCRIRVGGTRPRRLAPLGGEEARRFETQHDRRRTRRAVDADTSTSVVERQIPAVPPGHKQHDLVTGRRKWRAGRSRDLPGAKPLLAIDGLVDGATGDEDFAVSGPAGVVPVEQARDDANAIGREHQTGFRVFDSEGDLSTVLKSHRTGAGALHCADDDTIAHPHRFFEAKRPGLRRRVGNTRRKQAQERPQRSYRHGSPFQLGVRTTAPVAVPYFMTKPSSVAPPSLKSASWYCAIH